MNKAVKKIIAKHNSERTIAHVSMIRSSDFDTITFAPKYMDSLGLSFDQFIILWHLNTGDFEASDFTGFSEYSHTDFESRFGPVVKRNHTGILKSLAYHGFIDVKNNVHFRVTIPIKVEKYLNGEVQGIG